MVAAISAGLEKNDANHVAMIAPARTPVAILVRALRARISRAIFERARLCNLAVLLGVLLGAKEKTSIFCNSGRQTRRDGQKDPSNKSKLDLHGDE